MSAWAAVTTMAMLLFVGIGVDFGGQLQAIQNTRAVAAEAARIGGQQLNAPEAIRGQGAEASPATARSAAAAYIEGAGLTGSARIADGRIVVDTSATYRTKILSLIGIDSLPASGHASARIARAVEGVEQ
ncbi:pilus assembly protein [Isoptericola sp. S6320L]|uniref:pilus assembly protein n=1 Tax=Isoptericola sp. S6320L TaxID=2926411 RepID=UPI001FF6697E|nr:pilus assembly protein [Isoptericola sp. S6320L]MCK0116994.1 pilus assembly protein [Isoptericola sp. S6320L]